jgi:hypothetical protein
LYIEGGATGAGSKEAQARCRESFRKLLRKAGLPRQPRLSACDGRENTFDDFRTAHLHRKPGDYIAMLVDSEGPVADGEQPWSHLKAGDDWDRPGGADEDQVLMMTTCMETWIVADRATLRAHYGEKLQESALPPLHNLEARPRHEVQDRLIHATRDCKNRYAKGPRSFEVVGMLQPPALQNLPGFARAIRISREKV